MKKETFTRYDYLNSMVEDVVNYIKENGVNIKEKPADELYDELFCDDYITGNGTFDGYPYFEAWMLENNEELFYQAMYEFGYDNIGQAIADYKMRGGRDVKIYKDTTIRCYLLYQAIDEAYKMLQN